MVAVECEKDVQKVDESLHELGIPPDVVSVGQGYGAGSGRGCIPPAVFDLVPAISAPGFGGYYLEGDIAYIYLLDPSQEIGENIVIDELGRYWSDETEVRVLQAQYTWKQLREWYHLIWRAEWREHANIRSVDLNPEDNRVTLVGLRDDDLDLNGIARGLADLGIPLNAITLYESAAVTLDEHRKR